MLSVSRTHHYLKGICHGDPKLRKVLQVALKQEKLAVKNFILNPGGLTQVIRNRPSQMFSKNMQDAKKRDIHLPYMQASFPKISRTKEEGPMKRKKTDARYTPYRL